MKHENERDSRAPPEGPTGIDRTLVEEIIRRVLKVAQPERIILFGSAATGQMTPDSDVDLLILKPTSRDLRGESIRIREAVRGLGYPFDIVVMATERFEETKGVIGGMAHPANKYGKVIYESSLRL